MDTLQMLTEIDELATCLDGKDNSEQLRVIKAFTARIRRIYNNRGTKLTESKEQPQGMLSVTAWAAICEGLGSRELIDVRSIHVTKKPTERYVSEYARKYPGASERYPDLRIVKVRIEEQEDS